MTESKSLYFHIYREVNHEEIFVDDNDYQVFVNFLKNYFSDATKVDSIKKTFVIRGRTYQGKPHQPQNYFNQLELLAYKLGPNRFDLLIKQIVPGSMEKFIRALSTRYALYFNKKHSRTGALYKDPYKSHEVKDLSALLHLTRDIHSNFSNKNAVSSYHYSSYPEYLGQRVTEWIKSQVVLSIDGVSDYKSFVEGGRTKKRTKHTSPTKPKQRIPEVIFASLILILLTSYSVFKIRTTTPTEIIVPTPSSTKVLGDEDKVTEKENPTPRQVMEKGIIVIIKIYDKSASVNIYQNPSTSSAVIGKSNHNEVFQFVSSSTGWFQIKLVDGSTGYVPDKYAELLKEDLR